MRPPAAFPTGILASALAALGLAACEPGGVAPPASTALTPGAASLPAFLDCLDERGVTLVSAHRGGPDRGYPENAVATFARTVSRTPAILEIDVRATRDGVLVLAHDDDLDDATTCRGAISESAADELSFCRLRDYTGRATGFSISHLDEALEWAGAAAVLQLDVKAASLFDDAIAAVRRAGATDRVIFITYNLTTAARLARDNPDLVFSVTIDEMGDLDRLTRNGVDLDQLVAWTGTDGPDEALLAALDARGVPAIVGTLGGRGSIDRAIENAGNTDRYRAIADDGADIIATDRPFTAARALARDQDLDAVVVACREG